MIRRSEKVERKERKFLFERRRESFLNRGRGIIQDFLNCGIDDGERDEV